MTKIDISRIDAIIRDVAQTQVMTRFRKLVDGDVEMKGVNDPVTVADKETERHLTERLMAELPGSVVVGEESFAKDPSILGRIAQDAPVWIIDPIDGTRNFVAGKPEFAVMIALIDRNQAVASWIHDPNSGDTIMAEKGAGIWLRGKRVKLAAHDDTVRSVGVVGSRVKKLIVDPSIMPDNSDMPLIEIGSCAGFDYPRLFSGEVTFADAPTSRAQFLLYRHTNAWDHAPGLFLHHEGGGYSADWQGKPYDMTEPRAGLLITSDKANWDKLHSIFKPLMDDVARRLPA